MTSPAGSPRSLSPYFARATEAPDWEQRALSGVARGLAGSAILKIAADVRALQAEGRAICNLTVGDFAPSQFRIPERLEQALHAAVAAGETNYPPSDGLLELRKALLEYSLEALGLEVPVESVLIAAGARPIIYGAFRALLDPGEKVLFTTPSWNYEHYAFLCRAEPVPLVTGPETGFLPTAEAVRPLLAGVRLLCVNTPLNPSGTVMTKEQVRGLADLVVEENERRERSGERALFVLWDQVYWTLTFGDASHHVPSVLVPEAAPWTILVDAISKSFAATGLRVGWVVAAPALTARMRDILGHVGAWAPRPEQAATAAFLADSAAVAAYREQIVAGVRARLTLLHDAFESMHGAGLPVESLPPQGAIYLSVRFDLVGRSVGGRRLSTNEDIRRLLLEEAGFAVVPFQAFGMKAENGWMRLSVGAVSPAAIAEVLPRVRAVLERVEPGPVDPR